ncbi:MAG: SIMPL domain-containing protein, partial [Acetobacteraceae bacterium]|nr:SIMPL domain-containing protein [Acetobacteraceae bacterium]MBV8574288.1 SIMPL domain-containing protein [Acetobacteraceae bacterium]
HHRSACPALHGARASDRSGPPGIEPDSRTIDDAGSRSRGAASNPPDGRSGHAPRADRAGRSGRHEGCRPGQSDPVHRSADRTDPARGRPKHRARNSSWVCYEPLAFKIALAAACLIPLCAAPARADTLLRLAETATVSVPPDELAATVRAESSARTASDAQQKVNATVADALRGVKQVPGITVSTGMYNVWRSEPNSQDRDERWHAFQLIALHTHDGASLLNLVGELQQKQLAVQQLAWQLAPETEQKARRDATVEALKILRSRADDAAALIGLQFDSFREVRLDNPRPPIAPRALAAASMAASVAEPPSAEAEKIPVSATVEADVVLKPR